MGGLISTFFAITRQPDIDGLLLSGAMLKIPDEYPSFLIQLIEIISILSPKLPLLKIDASDVSRDPEVVEAYDTDPLVYRGGIPARTATEMNRAMEVVRERMEAIEGPLLIMHGTADRLADPEGSEQLYARANSNDKTLKWYEGLYHEILNEPEQDRVLADVVEWLDGH
jgi:alpha-beta hydrolase superfamily lysophospholipase